MNSEEEVSYIVCAILTWVCSYSWLLAKVHSNDTILSEVVLKPGENLIKIDIILILLKNLLHCHRIERRIPELVKV